MFDNTAMMALESVEIYPEELVPQDDEQLAQLLEDERTGAIEYRETERGRQIDGKAYYLADRNYFQYTRANPRATTSQMVSKDVAESIDDLMPDMERVLLANDQIVEFEATSAQDAQHVEAATALINGLFRRQRDFFDHLHDYIKDGLVSKLGVFEIVVQSPEDVAEIIPNVHQTALQHYAQQAGVVNLEAMEGDLPEGYVNLKVWRRKPREFRVESIPPEELLVSHDAASIDQSTVDGPRYVSITKRMKVSSAIQQWPEKRELWIKAAKSNQSDQTDTTSDSVAGEKILHYERERGEAWTETHLKQHNLLQAEMVVMREYYRADFDGDGYPELSMIIRVGKVIIHREAVADNPFAYWQPYRIPHVFWGESQADKAMNIQDLKTSLWRILNDGAALAAMPRPIVNAAALNRSPEIPTLDDIHRWQPGGVIRTAGPPSETLTQLQVGDVVKPAADALSYADQVKEGWTGQSRRQRGLDPEAVANESGVKFDKLIAAGSGRREFLARRLAKGIEMLGRKMLQEVTRYGSEMPVRVRGQWTTVDATRWPPTMQPIVHVSAAVGNRDIETQHLQMLIMSLGQFMGTAGPTNPWVSLMEYSEAVREFVQSMGFRDHDRFVKSPDQQQVGMYMDALNRKKDPMLAKAEIEAATKKDETKTEALKDQKRLSDEHAQEMAKIQANAATEGAKIDGQTDIKKMEFALRRWEKRQDMTIEREKMEAQKETAKMQAQAAKARPSGSSSKSN